VIQLAGFAFLHGCGIVDVAVFGHSPFEEAQVLSLRVGDGAAAAHFRLRQRPCT
jgi:hypothetical protein